MAETPAYDINKDALSDAIQMTAQLHTGYSQIVGSLGQAYEIQDQLLNSAVNLKSQVQDLYNTVDVVRRSWGDFQTDFARINYDATKLNKDQIIANQKQIEQLNQMLNDAELKEHLHYKEVDALRTQLVERMKINKAAVEANSLMSRFGVIMKNIGLEKVHDSIKGFTTLKGVMAYLVLQIKGLIDMADRYRYINNQMYGNTVAMARTVARVQMQAGVLADEARAAYEALRDVAIDPTIIEASARALAEFAAETGIAAEVGALFAKRVEAMGMSSQVAQMQFNYIRASMQKFGLTAHDSAAIMGYMNKNIFLLTNIMGKAGVAKFGKEFALLSGFVKVTGGDIAEFVSLMEEMTENAEKFIVGIGSAFMLGDPAERMAVLMDRSGAMVDQLAGIPAVFRPGIFRDMFGVSINQAEQFKKVAEFVRTKYGKSVQEVMRDLRVGGKSAAEAMAQLNKEFQIAELVTRRTASGGYDYKVALDTINMAARELVGRVIEPLVRLLDKLAQMWLMLNEPTKKAICVIGLAVVAFITLTFIVIRVMRTIALFQSVFGIASRAMAADAAVTSAGVATGAQTMGRAISWDIIAKIAALAVVVMAIATAIWMLAKVPRDALIDIGLSIGIVAIGLAVIGSAATGAAVPLLVLALVVVAIGAAIWLAATGISSMAMSLAELNGVDVWGLGFALGALAAAMVGLATVTPFLWISSWYMGGVARSIKTMLMAAQSNAAGINVLKTFAESITMIMKGENFLYTNRLKELAVALSDSFGMLSNNLKTYAFDIENVASRINRAISSATEKLKEFNANQPKAVASEIKVGFDVSTLDVQKGQIHSMDNLSNAINKLLDKINSIDIAGSKNTVGSILGELKKYLPTMAEQKDTPLGKPQGNWA